MNFVDPNNEMEKLLSGEGEENERGRLFWKAISVCNNVIADHKEEQGGRFSRKGMRLISNLDAFSTHQCEVFE